MFSLVKEHIRNMRTENIDVDTEQAHLLRAEIERLKNQISQQAVRISILEEENSLLRIFEEDYKAISEQALVGIVIAQGGKFIYASDGFAAITGHPIASVLNQSKSEMLVSVHPDDREKVANLIDRRSRAQRSEIFSIQYRILRRDGRYIWVEGLSKRIQYRGSLATIITYVDITDKMEYQSQMYERQQLFSNLFDNSPTGLLFASRDGEILEANAKVLEMMGSPSYEATKQINLFTFQPIIDCGFAGYLRKSIDDGTHCSGTTRYCSKWGKNIWVDYYFDPIYDKSGSVAGTLINFIDVTAKYSNEVALRESEEKLRKIFLSSPNAITVIDRNGYITNCNDRQVAIFGFPSKSEVIGRHASELISMEVYSELKSKIIRNTEQLRVANYECRLTKLSGEEFYAEITGGMIYDDASRPHNFIAVIQDITKRKNDEQELILAKNKAEESNRLKTAFLENMSHEIRTPLNGIIGFLDIITDEDITQEEKSEFVGIVHSCAQQLISIINDILEVSKITSGQIQLNSSWIDFDALMHEAYTAAVTYSSKQYHSQATLTYQNNMRGMNSMLYADAEKLRQVVSNLLNNALKFCTDGRVTMTSEYSEHLGLLVAVSDTGIGIPQNKLDVVFERFRQVDESMCRQYGGAGLGLSICRSLVELHGGTIWAESQLGEGSTFYFTLPYSPVLGADTVKNSLQPNSVYPGKKILVVDPSLQVGNYIIHTLRSTGAEVSVAGDLAQLSQLLSDSPQYHIILADAMVMCACKGFGLESVLASCPIVPLVLCSTTADAAERRRDADGRYTAWATKPWCRSKLFAILDDYML